MTDNNHILLAYGFNEDGTATLLKGKAVSVELENEGLAWVHLDANNPKTRTWLKKEVSYLDQIILDALLADETRPRLVEFENGSLLILRGINFNEKASPEDMVSVRLWIDSQRIISLQKRNVKAVFDIAEEIKAKKVLKTSGEFISLLSKKLLSHLQPFLDNLDEETADIEEKILDNSDDSLREHVINVRKQTITFKRHLAPQKEVISRLKNCTQDWLNDLDRRNLQESHENMVRHIEDLDELKERSQIIHDELFNSINQRVNKNMYILSVIAAIFLPLTFFTGLLGMNVAGIPMATSPIAFYMVSFVLLVIVLLQIWLFKKQGWF